MADINSSVRFVLRSLGPFAPDFEERIARHIIAMKRDSSDDDRWMELLDEALSREDGQRWCWFDNAEELAHRPAAAMVAERVLREVRLGSIVCSRAEPALPSFSRTPPNESYRISIDDLKFSDAESATLFSAGQDELVAEAIGLARGWPIAALTFARAQREGRLASMIEAARSGGALRDFDAYTRNEALGALSHEAKVTLFAIALLGRASFSDLALLVSRLDEIRAEFAACPLVLVREDALEAHPIAASALAPLREESKAALRRGAKNVADPLRAAQIFVAAGDTESAADVFDLHLAPFMYGQPTPAVAELIGAFDRATLVRHAATWCATISLRIYVISPDEFLSEAREVWERLGAETPLALRIGVGLSLINSLLVYFDRTQEALDLLGQLERLAAAPPADDFSVAVLRVWTVFARFRKGVAFDEVLLEQSVQALSAAVPIIGSARLIALGGPAAFLRGDRERSRRAFADALEIARNANAVLYEVLALTNGAFHAWLAGENVLFERYVADLRALSEPTLVNGTRHFIACSTHAEPVDAPVGFETRYIRAFGFLIAAAREPNLAKRGNALRSAVDAAIASGDVWLHALCRLCTGLAEPSNRDAAFAHAVELAAAVEYPAFARNVAAVIAGNLPHQWSGLEVFVTHAHGAMDWRVSLGFGEIRLAGEAIGVSRREMELLFALALNPSGCDRKSLAAMIWPDMDESGGGNAVAVNMSRLRKRLGNGDAISSGPTGYRLARNVALDLFQLEEWNREHRTGPLPDTRLEGMVSGGLTRLPQWIILCEWLAPYVRRFEAALHAARAMRLEAALQRNNLAQAAQYRLLLEAEGED